MALANIHVRLHRTELACPQLRAHCANGLSSRRALGKLNEQAIRELVACFVAVDVGHDHFDRACLIKFCNEFCSETFAFETSERTKGLLPYFLRQPFPRLAAIWFDQERTHKDIQNAFLGCATLGRQFGRFASKPRQRFVLCCCLTICVGADNLAAKIKSFREQRPIAQPHSVSSAELTAHGRDFELGFSVVMPLTLDARAVNHRVFAEQPSRFIPLAADAVEQSILVAFFRCADAVLVPDADNTMPASFPQGHSLSKLSASIKELLDGGTHNAHTRFAAAPRFPCPLNVRQHGKPNQSCSPRAGNKWRAHSTRRDKRHREAPLRDMRKAVPDGTRISAALSSGENSRFSRGTKPMRRTTYYLIVTSFNAASPVASTTVSRIPARGQHRFHPASHNAANCAFLSCFLNRAATDSRDENLKANFPAAADGSKEERKRERLSEPTRSILDAPDAAIQSAGISSRYGCAPTRGSE